MNINDYKDTNGNVEVSETLISDLIGGVNGVLGSNANGYWYKFENGLMIAWGKTSITGANTSWYISEHGWFYSPEIAWDYPAGFIETPHLIASFDDERLATRGTMGVKSRAESTYALFRVNALRVDVSDNAYPIIITAFLIGRWK